MEDYEKKYKEALSRAATELETCGADKSLRNMIYAIFPDELKESEDERIRKALIRFHKSTIDVDGIKGDDIIAWLEKQGENCLVNFDEAEKEKYDFVSGQFIECRKSFNGFKEDNSYWLEYVGDDNYIGRSDNILNQKFHITPRQLFTLFTWQHRPKENNVNEETNAPTGYGKYVDECLNEASKHFFSEGEDKYSVADLFYAGVRCGKSWLEKQAEQELQLKEGKYYECIKSYYYLGGGQYWFDKGKVYFCEKDGYLRSDPNNPIYVYDCENWQSYFRPYIGKSVWSEEDEIGLGDTLWAIKQARTIAKDENDMGNLWYAENWLKSIKSRISLKQEWSEEDEDYINDLIKYFSQNERLKNTKEDIVIWLKSIKARKGE